MDNNGYGGGGADRWRSICGTDRRNALRVLRFFGRGGLGGFLSALSHGQIYFRKRSNNYQKRFSHKIGKVRIKIGYSLEDNSENRLCCAVFGDQYRCGKGCALRLPRL